MAIFIRIHAVVDTFTPPPLLPKIIILRHLIRGVLDTAISLWVSGMVAPASDFLRAPELLASAPLMPNRGFLAMPPTDATPAWLSIRYLPLLGGTCIP